MTKQKYSVRRPKKTTRKIFSGAALGCFFAIGSAGLLGYHNYDKNRPTEIEEDSLFKTSLANDAKYKNTPLRLSHQSSTYILSRYLIDTVTVDTAFLRKETEQNGFRVYGGYIHELNQYFIKYFKVNPRGTDPRTAAEEKAKAARSNDPAKIALISIHEGTHQDNQAKGLKDFGVSNFQFAKICIHDEISANIAELLEMREKYLQTGDIKAIAPRYKFYREALLKQKISPRADRIPAADELRLIANGMRDWWCKANQKYYEKNHIIMIRNWMRRGFKHKLREKALNHNLKEKHRQEYLRRLNDCYTFQIELKTGEKEQSMVINFLNYMDNDVSLSQEIKQAIIRQASYPLKLAYQEYKDAHKNLLKIQTAAARQDKPQGTVLIKNRNIRPNTTVFEKKNGILLPLKNQLPGR